MEANLAMQEHNTLQLLQRNLSNAMDLIDTHIMRGYLEKLPELAVMEPDEELLKCYDYMQFFKITELVYEKDEFSVFKLATVLHTLSEDFCSVALVIRSDGLTNHFYLGVRSQEHGKSTGRMRKMLSKSMKGIFPGTRIHEIMNNDPEIQHTQQDIQHAESVSCVSCVADYKRIGDSITNNEFIQGLEKFVMSMRGQKYTAVLLADNIGHDELQAYKLDCERVYTQISPFAEMQVNYTVSESLQTGQSDALGQGKNFTKGTTITEGKTRGTSETETRGKSISESKGTVHTTSNSFGDTFTVSRSDTFSISKSWGHSSSLTVGMPGAPSATVGESKSIGLGYSHSKGTSNSVSYTRGTSDSVSDTLTHGFNQSLSRGVNESDSQSAGYSASVADTFSLTHTDSFSETKGESRGLTLNAKNMTLKNMMHRIEQKIKRIEECESIGMWNFAAYFLGEDAYVTKTAANIYHSLMSGNESGAERSLVHTWCAGSTDDSVKARQKKAIEALTAQLSVFCHPLFMKQKILYADHREFELVSPAVLVSTNELALHMGLPRHSVKGLPVVEYESFAQEVVVVNDEEETDCQIPIGHVFHMGEETHTPLSLHLESLTSHTFVTGSTGSGKSNTVYHILQEVSKLKADNGTDQSAEKKVAFLVIEPAKGEYRAQFPQINYYCSNEKYGQLIQINPFSFPKEIHVLEHIDRLTEILNVCWPMYAAMPAVLKSAIEKAYQTAGWDMNTSENKYHSQLFPTFEDVLHALDHEIQESAYSEEVKGNYIGSLSTRLKSMTNGLNRKLFCAEETNLHILFDESSIVDLSRIGSSETKSLIMGLLILKLQEYRMSQRESEGIGANAKLRHITVLEEAHNILKKTSTEQSQESSNLIGKSVEMLTNTIAEIRTFGEGFIIVDQAPNLLDTAAIRNTNTKIIMRLPEESDRQITGKSAALKDDQIPEIAKLAKGVAVVYQNNWREAVLGKIKKAADPVRSKRDSVPKQQKTNKQDKKKRGCTLLKFLLRYYLSPRRLNESQIDKLLAECAFMELNAAQKVALCKDISELKMKNMYCVIGSVISHLIDHPEHYSPDKTIDCMEAKRQMSNAMLSDLRGFTAQEHIVMLHSYLNIQMQNYPDDAKWFAQILSATRTISMR